MKSELGYYLPKSQIDNIQSGDLSIHESETSKPYEVGLTFVCNNFKCVYHISDKSMKSRLAI